ncbi:MAG: hypothetical protein IIY12_00880 [Clostridia bacterium]|nr:hypothetical protein [Clostridia bacterium]MBQ1965924.1 hypothetical protein [Clostridia bacterium]
MSFRSKVENIWYHYKSMIIVGIFLIGTLIVSLHSCATKPEFDVQVYYVSGSSPMYTEQFTWIEELVAAHCGDVNGDGKVTVAVTGLRVDNNTDPSERAKYMNAVQAGEVMLLFGDQGGIDYLYRNNYLQQLYDFTDDTDGEGYAWNVSKTPLFTQISGSDIFSEDLYVSLRVFDDTWSSARPNVKNNYAAACDTLRSMIASVSEE